ncbi:ALP1-like protein [Tanacetum coccineum]
MQMGATTARDSLRIFCKVIINLYGEEFLRKPTYTDMEKLYAYHNEKHGFPGMLGSIDCTIGRSGEMPSTYNNTRISIEESTSKQEKDVERAFSVLNQKWKLDKISCSRNSRSRLPDVKAAKKMMKLRRR